METTLQPPKKIIIDTDPGIDDAMAIFVALRSPEVEVIGLTTIYGNVCTTLATRNALHLLEVAGRTDIPVAEGSHVTITKGTKLRRADFVHGADGLGNQNFPPPEGKPIEQSAAAFLVQKANLYPGKVTVVALGPLTNIALAIQLDPAFVKNIGQIVVLGGAFAVNGSVNPAAETNIFGDPDAADIVFTSGADVLAVGINVTHQVVLTDTDRDKLAQSGGKFAHYLCKILDVYFSYHHDSYCMKGVYLHDPTALLAAVNPSLITYTEGIVRVQTIGITRGLTLFYNKQKRVKEHFGTQRERERAAAAADEPRGERTVDRTTQTTHEPQRERDERVLNRDFRPGTEDCCDFEEDQRTAFATLEKPREDFELQMIKARLRVLDVALIPYLLKLLSGRINPQSRWL